MKKIRRLCIDPGHGMGNRRAGVYDPGAVAAGVAEADQALLWALTLKHRFLAVGVPVWMTRTDDRSPAPLGVRAARAEAAGCSHFLSVHFNASKNPLATGVETFYRDQEDLEFAKLVQGAALKATGLRDRGTKHERLTAVGVLSVMNFKGPCALVEPGFITKAGDRRVIQDREVRIQFADALIDACGLGRAA